VKHYLLDTHILYWWMTDDTRLGAKTRRLIARADATVSAVSLWEMVLKNARGKLPLPPGPLEDEVAAQGFSLLSLLPRHINAMRGSKYAHSDPFDCLLLAQALDENLVLLTADAAILALKLPYTAAAL
jgi:PIN domain nuclease of toxin-antitoxin system